MQTGEAAALHTLFHSSGFTVQDDELLQAWSDLCDNRNGVNWVAARYGGGDKSGVVLAGKGSGTILELKETLLSEDALLYGCFSVWVDGRRKRVFLCFIGDNVSGLVGVRLPRPRETRVQLILPFLPPSAEARSPCISRQW